MRKLIPIASLIGLLVLAAGCIAPLEGTLPVSPEGEGREVTLYVGPELADCVGVAPMKCLQVRENLDDEYQFFYGTIDGFDYEPGYVYELRVRIEPVPNPPADGSSLSFTMVEQVSKTPAESGGETDAESGGDMSMDETDGLEGSDWVLAAYRNDQGELQDAPAEPEVTALFSTDGFIAGSGGCNNYRSSYSLDGDKIFVGPGMSTMMACEESIMALEQAYLTALAETASFTLEGGDLLLLDADGELLLRFAPAPAEEESALPASDAAATVSPLVGVLWSWVEMTGADGAVTTVDDPSRYTMEFNAEGRVAARADCNRANGSYSVEGETLAIEMRAMTRAMCPPGSLSQPYVNALNAAASYSVENGALTVTLADDGVMLFIPIE